MKKIIFLALIFLFQSLVAQKVTTKMIDQFVETIEADSTLVRNKIDLIALKNDLIGDDKKLEVWYKGNQIFKIVSVKELFAGKHHITIYLKGNNPIKIIEQEESIDNTSDRLNKQQLKKVYEAIVYEFNREKELRGVVVKGKRVLSKASFPPHVHEKLLNDAKSSLKI